jgi:hypothetical protein
MLNDSDIKTATYSAYCVVLHKLLHKDLERCSTINGAELEQRNKITH